MFDAVYKNLYGQTYPEAPIEFVTFKVRAGLPERPFQIPSAKRGEKSLNDCVKGERLAFSIARKNFVAHTVYDRGKLFAGCKFRGPAIVEEKESTTVVGENARAVIDEFGFIRINVKGRS